MEREGREVHIDTTEARAGSTPHVVRYVLIIGLFLAIAALSAIWITGALSTNDQQHESTQLEREAAAEADAGAGAGAGAAE